MMPGPLLTTSPLSSFGVEVVEASLEALPGAAGLLVPHDREPVADVRDRPDRWALLTLLAGAVRRRVPVLAWGSGAALAGRVLGARVRPGKGAADWSEAPRGATVERWQGDVPLLWRMGPLTAWAGEALPGELRTEFLASLTEAGPRAPGSPLEAVGGEAALRALLADFYTRARQDELLGPVFAAHVQDWTAHLDRVTAFWITMLGGRAAWRGNLNSVHADLGIRGAHLTRWLALFRETAEGRLAPEATALLIPRAEAMGARLGRRGPRNAPHVRRVP